MQLNGSTALVTGANRGIGHHFVVELLRRGAKVYATARRPELVTTEGAEVLRLDITDEASVDAATVAAPDVDLLVNNAAAALAGDLMTADLGAIREAIDTNFYGTLAMIRAFAPVLARNGGGAILNVGSAAAWRTVPGNTAYAAAKSAQWGLTNAVRVELAGQGTLVSALYPSLVDTEPMREFARAAGVELPSGLLHDPQSIVRLALDGIEASENEILDPLSRSVRDQLPEPPRALDLAEVLTAQS